MKSLIIKHSVVINGHKTSVSLEPRYWQLLKRIAAELGKTVSAIVAAIDDKRRHGNLSSAIRLFVIDTMDTELLALRARAPAPLAQAA